MPMLVAPDFDADAQLCQYLETHGTDGIGDQDEAAVVGLVGDPESGGVGVDSVRDNSIPNLETR
jgi:hypothetical protein